MSKMNVRATILPLVMFCASTTVWAQHFEPGDTLHADPDTLTGVVVTPDNRLPINVSDIIRHQPRTKSVSDVIGGKATDMIMHPFAVTQRKKERHRKRMNKAMMQYELIKDPNEELREALAREGLLEQVESKRNNN